MIAEKPERPAAAMRMPGGMGGMGGWAVETWTSSHALRRRVAPDEPAAFVFEDGAVLLSTASRRAH
jgi:hypothetical protein